MRIVKGLGAFALSLLMVSCGGDDSGGSSGSASISFSVSDAPVDSAQEVVIAFDQVELVVSDEESIFLDVDSGANDYVQVDLLDYQGTDSLLIVSNQVVPVGSYENLILHISDESGVSYVVDNNGQQNLKQPSNKLKLGEFEVGTESVQAFTIEFVLRMSLVMRGNQGNNNGYILKPHGVTIVDNSEAVSLSGTVDTNLFDEGDACSLDSSSMVYLYSGGGLDSGLLIDLVDPDDETFTGEPAIPDGSIAPVASVEVADNGTYQFGFLTAGDYMVAFACDGDGDDAIEYNPEIIIPMAPTANSTGDKFSEVTLVNGQQAVVDFSY
ncbi:DUF4382 domain-containing protein [Vibrio sp. SCSIO 43135]|uniref:DUF4382 domain-containing protein n=1 Tax=Vibrio sp. SCSIO 43135 TaxID=2819096 RepID=UPI0020752E9B|nr:DUF4382 domain-containing protein [Vibrio sp. SCSIO 43135]USD43669.1 DUF4382 domain-containing protein [Vibrio sp. SCSIO 43135]